MNNKNKNIAANQDEGKLVRVEIADATGHQTLMLSPQATEEYVSTQEDKWVFVDNRLIEAEHLAQVDWNQTQSVRVMPGLVGGVNPPDLSLSFGLVERSSIDEELRFEQREQDRFWRDGRLARIEGLIHLFHDSIGKNLKALDLLKQIIVDNQETIRIGRKNIIVIGDLASYAIPIKPIIENFTNIFSTKSSSGFDRIEIHPRDRWVHNHVNACIQVSADLEMPSIDTFAGLILGLKNDKTTFHQESLKPLRDGLISTYGYCNSPITESLSLYLKQCYGAIHDTENHEIRVKGTHGWTWHIEYGDPETIGFRISSTIRNGKKRLHFEDSKHGLSWTNSIEEVLDICVSWPKSLLDKSKNHYLSNSKLFRDSIIHHWAPFAKEFEKDPNLISSQEEDEWA